MPVAIDTNVLVRYITRDDPDQTALADEVLERRCSEDNPGWVSQVVLCELAWVLRRSYGADREQIARVLEGLLQARQLLAQAPGTAWKALADYQSSRADFADALIARAAEAAGCTELVTFDRAAAELPRAVLLGDK